ncbi:MAG: thymidine phosphorylase [Candidatus Promineifilaceae bacterium]
MNIIDIIEVKRDGGELSTEQIEYFVRAYTAGEIADYQAAALLMAIYINGMSRRETVDLTLAMAHSGEELDLHDVAPFVVDKHSSGGVGDKTTLVVQPVVAACGVPVGKMSGRGLGSSGGTLDKMESIAGWTFNMPLERFKKQLADIGLVLAGQSMSLAPADGKIYALRDVTGTVANKSLIAASIMSKKLAGGADGIVLDVKAGCGAFMQTVDDARDLARIMVDIGVDAGRRTVALISDMNQPLGYAVGNALEVKEALDTLHGGGPEDFWRHARKVAGYMLLLAGKGETIEEAELLATAARANGQALAKFREMVIAQGGDVSEIDDPRRLPQARYVSDLVIDHDGYIAAMDTAALGWASVDLGAGRLLKGDTIDHAVGFLLTTKVGDKVSAGQVIGEVHANDEQKMAEAQAQIGAAITVSDKPIEPLPAFYGVVS